jgi:fructose-1,6-bisphosphatase II
MLHNANQPTVDIFAATIAAAAASFPLVGRGNKFAVDMAAVDAMRQMLIGADFGGVVVIGEGEKDSAPMLFNGEVIGQGQPIEWDIAVDPIDGTALAAAGIEGAVTVMAASRRGTMLDCSEVFYMKKLITGPAGHGVVDIDRSVAANVASLAAELGKDASELRVAVIDKPRNEDVIAQVQAAGAQWVQFAEGDVAMGVAAATEDSGIDMLLGVGGAPEGVATACAVRVLGGFMQARLAPQDVDQIERAMAAGYDLERKFEVEELVGGEDLVFVLTGITDGLLTRGIRAEGDGLVLQTLVLDSELVQPHVLEVEVARP